MKRGEIMENTKLEELITKEKRAYFKKWREENKEKVRKSNANYWKRRVEKKLKELNENESEKH